MIRGKFSVLKIISFTKKLERVFFCIVIIPTLLAIVYYTLIASDVYISEASFAIREDKSQDNTNGVLATKNISPTDNKVHDYMVSRDALTILNQKYRLASMYDNSHVDVFNRFALWGWADSFEDLYEYYKKKISVDINPETGICTLKTRAYTADDAWLINHSLIHLGEKFVNNLNKKSQKDLIIFAKKQLNEAENRAKDASLALTHFRIKKQVINPNNESALQLKSIINLKAELVATKNRLTQLHVSAPENPQIAYLVHHQHTLEKTIAHEKKQILGEHASLAQKSRQFERLTLEKDFSYKQLDIAWDTLKKAQLEAQQKHLYFQIIASPNRPDIAIEPYRIRNILSILFVTLIIYASFKLFVSNVKDHFE